MVLVVEILRYRKILPLCFISDKLNVLDWSILHAKYMYCPLYLKSSQTFSCLLHVLFFFLNKNKKSLVFNIFNSAGVHLVCLYLWYLYCYVFPRFTRIPLLSCSLPWKTWKVDISPFLLERVTAHKRKARFYCFPLPQSLGRNCPKRKGRVSHIFLLERNCRIPGSLLVNQYVNVVFLVLSPAKPDAGLQGSFLPFLDLLSFLMAFNGRS